MSNHGDPAARTSEWNLYESRLDRYRQTIQRDPRGTIRPEEQHTGVGYARALIQLAELRRNPGAPADTRFGVTDTLGIGGTAIVREATQFALDRPVALKTLRPDVRSEEAAAALLREAWVTGSLNHPNVVPIHDITLDETGAPLIVLERIDGQAWSDFMFKARRVRERFGAESLLEWNLGVLTQVLNVIQFAHSRGIMHRDIKPDNVMIGEFGEVYLVDWGLALDLSGDNGLLPAASSVSEFAGTPAYMAPEMLGWRDQPLSRQTDIYLIGAVLYEVLTGRPPHDADDRNFVASVIRSKPVLPKTIPRALARICRRAMDPDPSGRFENAEQVRLALKGFLQHRGSARLAMQAMSALSELEQSLASEPSTDAEHRQELYRLYGACRFGFREAISNWSGNDAARDGLERATSAMVEYELDQGDARAAAALCTNLDHPPEALQQRIEQLESQQVAEKQRFASLEELAHQHDVTVGQNARFVAMLVVGALFSAMPFVLWRQFGLTFLAEHRQLMSWTGGCLGLSFIVGLLLRRTIKASLINRRLFAMLIIILTAQLVMELGLWRAGFAYQQSVLMHLFMWFFALAGVSVTIDKRMLPSALVYLAVFLALAEQPGWELEAFALPHIALTLNAVVVWRPRSQAAER